MRSGSKSSQVGEVQILRDHESLVPLRCFPYVTVASATQVLISDRMNVVIEARQEYG
jgi:hypothetical protein